MTLEEVYTNDLITPQIAQAEHAADQAFKAQAACEHIWEKVEREVWQCEACGDLVGLVDEDEPREDWS